MGARRTPWWVYAAGIVVGFAAGALVALFEETHSLGLLGAPWFVSAILVLLGVVVLYLAFQVHKYTTTDPKKRAELKTFEPERAVNTLVMAKALAVAGAILLGWYGGQLVLCLRHAEASYYHGIIVECAIACGAALFDMIIGIVSEWLCMLPPTEGPDHPKIKEARRRQQFAH
ncbi:DUF3180 domain-containing protein [Bifidobacterium choloepi]|uniref:DUF3180 domain-containing protein n=1 Tax=Bifidobacterium choloepi TaxID=2614131 RepID=A0A6I5NDR8_9BIFI|nr:DUF3180 domain-containing protein [Bifidobacterium choloepi]NEG69544.1 DUF3180 domain-containing protein [Bifidobacterium choloepi]